MNTTKNTLNTKRLAITGLLCAIAFAVVVIFRVPIVLFLKYEPKAVIITIGGFIFGPLTAFIITLLVSVVEMFTISADGPIGLIMNVIATGCFACTASFIYKRKHTVSGAFIGLIAGTAVMTILMIIWNYLITPFYMGIPREEVVKLLVPAILPFNLLKGGLNTAFTMLLYKPIVIALRKANLIPPSEHTITKGKVNIGSLLIALLILATCIFFILALKGIA